MSEARELAHSIVALEVDPPKIRNTTKSIFAIFADYTSAIEAYSIDEAFLDLTGHVENYEAARVLALTIKERIKNEVGDWLKCSIGIAPTRWLAKFAGELQKPDGLTVLLPQDLPLVYAGMPVDKAWGIADGWKARLAGLGINTLGQLLKSDPLELKRRFGMPGYLLWSDIAGIDLARAKIDGEAPPKSIGHSYVFHRRTDDPKQISAIMMKLCERVGVRLRQHKFEAKRINVVWGYDAGSGGNSSRSLDPVFESYEIFSAAWRAFHAGWDRQTVTFLAITAHELAPTMGQISIFKDKKRRQNIAAALDAVNGRYGAYTVIRGQMWGTKEYAPDRVGFRQSVTATRADEQISSVEK